MSQPGGGPPPAQPPPGWHPDPYGRFELRLWDGARWTEHVSSGGVEQVEAAAGGLVDKAVTAVDQPLGTTTPEDVQRQVQEQGNIEEPVTGGGGSMFTEPILVVNQRPKVIEVTNEYAVYDRNGRQLGSVRQVGQTKAKKVMRVLTSLDQFMTHRLVVEDQEGRPVLELERPAKLFKSTLLVKDPAGGEIGRIVQDNMMGRIRFSLQSGGHTYGTVNAENWRAWNFSIRDHADAEIARITKTWEGLAKTMFTTADNYVVQIHGPLEDPLRSLVVAAALGVDTALKQDSRGLG